MIRGDLGAAPDMLNFQLLCVVLNTEFVSPFNDFLGNLSVYHRRVSYSEIFLVAGLLGPSCGHICTTIPKII